MEITDAKPCPFCGKSPSVSWYDNGKYTIECIKCKVIMGVKIYGGVYLDDGLEMFFDTKDEAVSSWNARDNT